MKTPPLIPDLAALVSTACLFLSTTSPAQAATITPKSQGRSVQAAVSFSGTFDPANPATVNKLTANPCIGQLNYADDAGVNQSVLINRRPLVTGRKLGTTP